MHVWLKRLNTQHNRLRPTVIVVTAESSGKEHICFYNGHRSKNRDEAISLVRAQTLSMVHALQKEGLVNNFSLVLVSILKGN